MRGEDGDVRGGSGGVGEGRGGDVVLLRDGRGGGLREVGGYVWLGAGVGTFCLVGHFAFLCSSSISSLSWRGDNQGETGAYGEAQLSEARSRKLRQLMEERN